MYKLTESYKMLQQTYLDLIRQESSNSKTKHIKRVGCYKCGATQTTLRKVGENRICDKCYKEQENER